MRYIIAYDLGTGGVKTALYSEKAEEIAAVFREYQTYFPKQGFQEQLPCEWWNAVVDSTKEVLSVSQKCGVTPDDIVSIGTSGHSLGVVAVNKNGELVFDTTPIWSDSRAQVQAERFFEKTDKKAWYNMTGNGFPAHLYSVFKIMWYHDNYPEEYANTYKFIGSKDYINLRLTGKFATDFSYASGSGVYNLETGRYSDEYIGISGIEPDKLCSPVKSTDVIGTLTEKAALELGLSSKTKVVCGGVDNACMALGADCFENGRSYMSVGSSAWIAVSSDKPVLDFDTKPYVFAHCVPDMYVSSTCIFSAGLSLRYIRDTICRDLLKSTDADPYYLMDMEANDSPVGSNGLIFNPSLSGGSSIEPSPNITGGFIGMTLANTRGDMIRSVLEGVAFNLRRALDILRRYADTGESVMIYGGGAKSKVWKQIFADIFECAIEGAKISQSTAALGAVVLAGVGTGIFENFDVVKKFSEAADRYEPNPMNISEYRKYYELFIKSTDYFAEYGDILYELRGDK